MYLSIEEREPQEKRDDMNSFTLAGTIFVVVLILLALCCLLTGQPWNALYAAIAAGWIANSVDNEGSDEKEAK